MKYLKVRRYISVLFKEGTKWEYKDILETKGNETTDAEIKKAALKKRLVILIFSIPVAFLLSKGFSKEFVGYIIAALSIFIGLFTNLIIALYQRNITLPTKHITAANEEADTFNTGIIKTKNFIKQFSFVTGKNLLISTLIILLSTFSLLFQDFFSINTSNFEVAISSEVEHVKSFLIYFFLLFYRTLIIYLLLDFLLLLLFSIGGLFSFLKNEYSES